MLVWETQITVYWRCDRIGSLTNTNHIAVLNDGDHWSSTT